MEVAQRLLDTIRAGREKGKGVGDALERAGNKVTGQYGAWGVAAGGGAKPVSRDEFPKRGVGPGELSSQLSTEQGVDNSKLPIDGESTPQTSESTPQVSPQSDKPTRQADKADFAAMTPDEVDAHMGGLKGKEYGDALRDMPKDVASEYLKRKTAADQFARRSRAGGKAAATRARRSAELDAKLSTETGRRLHEAEQQVKRLGERYKAGGPVTDAMFDRAQRELQNASLAHNLYTTQQNPDAVEHRVRHRPAGLVPLAQPFYLLLGFVQSPAGFGGQFGVQFCRPPRSSGSRFATGTAAAGKLVGGRLPLQVLARHVLRHVAEGIPVLLALQPAHVSVHLVRRHGREIRLVSLTSRLIRLRANLWS
jgi:hypothetical protein